MSRKSVPSLDELSAIIADVHDAGVGGAEWPATLARLGGLFDARGAIIWMQDGARRFLEVRSPEQNAEMLADYFGYYERLDELRPSVMRGCVGTILTDTMLISRLEFARAEFYADYASRYDLYDCMQAYVFDGPGCSGYLAITRPARVGTFERDDVRLLRLLLPHLRRAMETQLRLAALGVQRDSALEALDRLRHGILIVDAQARVIHVNAAAEAILRKADGLGAEPASKRLRASAHGQTSALRRLIAQAARRDGGGPPDVGGNGALRLDRATGTPLLLSVTPLWAETAWNVSRQPAVLILIAVPEDSEAIAPRHLRALYGLTTAEAAVAGRIAQGQGVKTAAEALGISPSTLSWHLRHVFEKTGTARQAELARLVERVGAASGNDGSL